MVTLSVAQGHDLCHYAARHEKNRLRNGHNNEDAQAWLHLDHLRLVLTVDTHVPALTCAICDLVASIRHLTLVPIYDHHNHHNNKSTGRSDNCNGWNWANDADWIELRDSLASACGQQLQVLECHHVGAFSVTWVTALLEHSANTMQQLQLHYATLYGTFQQFAALYHCLEDTCTALRKVRLTKCRLWDERGAASFDSLIRALAHLSTLESLELQKDDDTRHGRQVDQAETSSRLTALGAWLAAPSPQAPITSAFASPLFTRLALTGGFWLDDKCIADLARALQSNAAITHLTLQPIVAMGAGTDALALMLLANRRLEYLQVHVAGPQLASASSSNYKDPAASQRRQSTTRNSLISSRRSTVSSRNSIISATNEGIITPTQIEQWLLEIASILTVNATLQQLHVTHEIIQQEDDDILGEQGEDQVWTPRVHHAFAQVLEADNVTLEQVTVQSLAQLQKEEHVMAGATCSDKNISSNNDNNKDAKSPSNGDDDNDDDGNENVNYDNGAFGLGYFLILNQRGRRKFIQNINDTDWDMATRDSDRDQRDVDFAKQTWVGIVAGCCGRSDSNNGDYFAVNVKTAVTTNASDLERELYDLSCLLYFLSNTPLAIWQDAAAACNINDRTVDNVPRGEVHDGNGTVINVDATTTSHEENAGAFQEITDKIYTIQHELAMQQIQLDCKAEVRQVKQEHTAQLANLKKEHALALKQIQVQHDARVSMLEAELEQMRALVDASNNNGVEGHRKRLERFRRESFTLQASSSSKNRRGTTTAVPSDLRLRQCRSDPADPSPLAGMLIGVPGHQRDDGGDGEDEEQENKFNEVNGRPAGGQGLSAGKKAVQLSVAFRESQASATDAALFPGEIAVEENPNQSLDYFTEEE